MPSLYKNCIQTPINLVKNNDYTHILHISKTQGKPYNLYKFVLKHHN